MLTRDCVVIVPGMTVWVKAEVYPEPPQSYIVESISDDGKKVLFKNPGPNDYKGARIDGVFSTAEACVEALAKTRVKLDLHKDEAHLVLFAMAQHLKKIKGDLAIISIAKERELTQAEYSMLPALVKHPSLTGHVGKATREEIREQINPWISLEQDYEYIIELIQKEHDRACEEFLKKG